jgi:hypothetical protein
MAITISGDSPNLTSANLSSPTITGAVVSSMASSVITAGTAQASTSGTSIDFTGIPSWVKRITVMFNGVSTNGSSTLLLQTGAGSIQTTGYLSQVWSGTATNINTASSILIAPMNAAYGISGVMVINSMGSNVWVASCLSNIVTTANIGYQSVGTVTVSGTLDRIRISTAIGTDTFDAGSINILYE